MCSKQKTKKRPFWLKAPFLYSLMLLLGILAGTSEFAFPKALGLFISEIFISLFRLISLPIISLSIIVTLSSYNTKGSMRFVWRRAMVYTLGTTFIAALISACLYLIISPSSVTAVHAQLPPDVAHTGYLHHLTHLVPSNILSPFIEQQVISVLLLSILMGIAIRYIPDEPSKQVVITFFRGIHSLFMVATGWIIALIPIGLFGFITTTVLQMKSGMGLKGIGAYLMVVILANLVQGFLILPTWLKLNGIRPFVAMRAMFPALTLAFFSKSSVATLPVTMETAERNMAVKPEISRFILPFCTSLNMNGCAAFIFATVIYLMQNQGVPITVPMMALWVIIATIAAIGNAGVPMGCFFLSASLLASMNISITLMGVILPFYTLIDMLETSLNVWSDSCVAKVINEKMPVMEDSDDEEIAVLD